jgi:hypothetical protein
MEEADFLNYDLTGLMIFSDCFRSCSMAEFFYKKGVINFFDFKFSFIVFLEIICSLPPSSTINPFYNISLNHAPLIFVIFSELSPNFLTMI